MRNKKQIMSKVAPLFVIVAAMLWGILVIFVKELSKAGISAMETVALRVWGSAAFMLIGLFLTNRKKLRIHIKDSWCFVGTGLVSIVFFSYCYFRNVEVSGVAVASILMYTSPIFVTVLSAMFFKEKFTKMKELALFIAFMGCVLVSGIAGVAGIGSMESGSMGVISRTGILLGLGSGIGYALYSIFGRFALDKGYEAATVTTFTFLFACVGVLPFIHTMELLQKLLAEPKLIVLSLAMALFCTCFSFTLYTIGLQYMEAGRAAVLATLEPIISTLAGVVIYKQSLNGFMVVGIVLVLLAGIMSSAKPEAVKQPDTIEKACEK